MQDAKESGFEVNETILTEQEDVMVAGTLARNFSEWRGNSVEAISPRPGSRFRAWTFTLDAYLVVISRRAASPTNIEYV